MSSLRSLLQDADPLRHEAPHLDGARERIRLAIHRARAAGTVAAPSLRARRAFVMSAPIAALGAMALAYQLWTHGSVPVLAAVRFEVRLAEEQAVPGLVVARAGDSGRLIYLHPEVVVSNDDVAQSWVSEEGADRFGVALQLLPSAAERMRQATSAHIGRPVAILIDGTVVMAPVVRSPIGDMAVISGHYTRAQAEQIAGGITGR
jgi:preprotein translocase subunit SecD